MFQKTVVIRGPQNGRYGWSVVELDGSFACLWIDYDSGQVQSPLSRETRKLTGCHTACGPLSDAGVRYVASFVSRGHALRLLKRNLTEYA